MQTLTVRSPAKLNLHLRILGKRPDGYHKLLTLFHRISLADTIRIRKSGRAFRLTTNLSTLETGEGNLITKAYRVLREKYPSIGGVSVRLTKRTPLGGGLGGGSSNAAFFLLGMKKLYRLKIPEKELMAMGKKLGADVPFFLSEAREALAWGIGEKMQKQSFRGRLWFLLLVTDQGLNTRKIYQGLRWSGKPLSLTKEKRVARILRYFLLKKRIREAAELVRNDLESSAFVLRPSIPKAIAIMEKLGAPLVRMTGSGATVFAVFPSRQEVTRFARKLKRVPGFSRKVICHSL
ncbi:MAG TPA: 4-(cytidine 5'-diphospho)-2-C-methyl-D-erythritol kinase [Candidatus Omnitrophota bacterium]|nr:4-(cytidine 5'-diphospho)-2-C-methyl-D-erythritol kinase [Candidatus Omnitrophota bacterium]HPS37109.1 4-(cytidine 5'-diphospho)-2-C-methyl-D-erythritol kinase [Candidatus Omnitrophota bacterium]